MPPFYIWYGRQDLNLHAYALEPKSNVSANSTTPALSLILSCCSSIVNQKAAIAQPFVMLFSRLSLYRSSVFLYDKEK